MNVSYLKELDGIRAIAALMVLFFHFFITATDGSAVVHFISKVAVFGQTGVSLFFVLSGFLITRILLSTRASANFFSAFYLRRLLRIFPLYYFYLVLFYFVVPFLTQTDFISWGQQFWYWFYLQGFPMTFHWAHAGPDHFWSLGVEEHFYLFWPLLIYFIQPRYLLSVILLLIVLAFCLRIIFVQQSFETFYFTFTRMDELAMGALVAVLETRNKLKAAYFKRYVLLFVLSALLLLVLWVLTNKSGNAWLQVAKYNFISLLYFFLLCVVLTAATGSYLSVFLRTSLLNYLGRISYGLYVYHPMVFLLFKQYIPVQNVFFVASGSFVVTVIIASMSFYWFENRFLYFKRFFTYSSGKQPSTVKAAG